MSTCTCTDYFPLKDLSDDEVLKVVGTLLGNWDDGGICVWLVMPSNVCEPLGDSFIISHLKFDSLKLRYKRVTKDACGFGFAVESSAYDRAVLNVLETLARFAHANDLYVLIEPLGAVKNALFCDDEGYSEVM